jgi:hypothetical protein
LGESPARASEAAKIRSLTEEPRKIAIQVRERSPIKTSELYFMARGKPGRIPGNFYLQISRLEDAHLVAYTKNTGLVSWTLDEFVDGKLIDLADNEARAQMKEYLASLLLPAGAEAR